ncbi:MAG: sodium:calcium antiporter [Pirellulales bacterium]
MWLLSGEFLLLAAAIVGIGSLLSRFADQIAEITGLGRLLVGSVLLAGATSLPELTVDITAVRMGLPNLAAGDLLGSSLMNLLILALLDLTNYSRGKMLSREAAGHALSGMLSVTLTAFVGMAILTASRIEFPRFLGAGLPTWGILALYLLGVRVVFLDQRLAASAAKEALPPGEEQAHKLPPLWQPIVGFALAAAVLFFIGPRLAHTASKLAELSGLGNTFVGTTLVALCTSLPELVSSLAAIRLKAFDLAVGNVFGSNAFNIILFVPLDMLHDGPLYPALAPSHLVTCLSVIICTCITVMGQLYRVERRRKFVEPDAWLVILVVLGALFLVYRLP